MKEHRTSDRTAQNINVWLYKNESLIALATTQDLSSSGMFIKTNVLLFPKNSRVDIVFDNKEETKRYRVPARVVHRSLQGIGITLENLETEESLEIKRLLAKTRIEQKSGTSLPQMNPLMA